MFSFIWRFLLLAIGIAVGLFLSYQLWIFAHVWWWVDHNPANTAFMDARLDSLQKKNPKAALRHTWVPYPRISNHLKRAIIAAEDGKFLDHEGFDWEAMQKAHEKNQKLKRTVVGGSTISQQLAKNLFLSGERSMWRKGQEAIVTVMLETMMSKRRILEIYLNVIEWGNGVFGVEAAARHYFGVSAAQLGPEQAARLAAMVPNPRHYDRNRQAPWIAIKTRLLLGRMGSVQIP